MSARPPAPFCRETSGVNRRGGRGEPGVGDPGVFLCPTPPEPLEVRRAGVRTWSRLSVSSLGTRVPVGEGMGPDLGPLGAFFFFLPPSKLWGVLGGRDREMGRGGRGRTLPYDSRRLWVLGRRWREGVRKPRLGYGVRPGVAPCRGLQASEVALGGFPGPRFARAVPFSESSGLLSCSFLFRLPDGCRLPRGLDRRGFAKAPWFLSASESSRSVSPAARCQKPLVFRVSAGGRGGRE